MRKTLIEQGFDPIVIIDAGLRREIDDPELLEAVLEERRLPQAPADTTADYFVLEVAKEHDATSNDRFEEVRAEYPWIEDRRMPFMVVRGEIHLPSPRGGVLRPVRRRQPDGALIGAQPDRR